MAACHPCLPRQRPGLGLGGGPRQGAARVHSWPGDPHGRCLGWPGACSPRRLPAARSARSATATGRQRPQRPAWPKGKPAHAAWRAHGVAPGGTSRASTPQPHRVCGGGVLGAGTLGGRARGKVARRTKSSRAAPRGCGGATSCAERCGAGPPAARRGARWCAARPAAWCGGRTWTDALRDVRAGRETRPASVLPVNSNVPPMLACDEQGARWCVRAHGAARMRRGARLAHARARDPRRVCQGEGRRPMPGAVGRSVGRRRGQPHGVGASAKVGAQRVWVVTTGARALPSAWGGWPMNRLRARTVAGSTNSATFSLYLTVMSPATSGNAGRHARVSGSHLREQRSTQPPGPPGQPAQTQALHTHAHTHMHTCTHTCTHTPTHSARTPTQRQRTAAAGLAGTEVLARTTSRPARRARRRELLCSAHIVAFLIT